MTASARSCPCGSGERYAACCEPVHDGTVLAPTAERLMRSRFSAFALGRDDALLRSWHPRTRPTSIDTGGIAWTALEIVDTVDGGEGDDSGVVEFIARGRDASGPVVLHERSRFARRAGRWCYLDGDLFDS